MISEKETQNKSKLYIHCLQSMTPFYLELKTCTEKTKLTTALNSRPEAVT